MKSLTFNFSSKRVSMHLLVLSAFRPLQQVFGTRTEPLRLNAPFGAQCFPTGPAGDPDVQRLIKSQCTFWCSVLSDLQRTVSDETESMSQCTFWCSVLSDKEVLANVTSRVVSMHLLVLSAFRPEDLAVPYEEASESQCTFWCSVLSDPCGVFVKIFTLCRLNAPFGAQCFPTHEDWVRYDVYEGSVSMHLLVLSAFRRQIRIKRV